MSEPPSSSPGTRVGGPVHGHEHAGATELVVGAEHARDRLDLVLAAVTGTSRSRASRRIAAGGVLVDGVVRPRSHRLEGGERLVVAAEPTPSSSPPPPMPPVLYRDDHLAVVDKPAGLVVHPGHGHPDGTLVDALLAGGLPLVGGDPHRPGIVHRLDRDTSGALAVSLSQLAHDRLTEALRARTVTRSYLALVEGSLPAARGTIDVPLGRDPRDRVRFAPDRTGRDAVTHFAVQAAGRRPGGGVVQLVACRLETGRTHQIRVHLAHAGAPVVGDVTYGATPAAAADLGLSRPFLHALELQLRHPESGRRVVVEAPLPGPLADVLVAAGIPVTTATVAAVTWPEDAR